MKGRVPPLGAEAWPPEVADLENGFAGRLNVYRTMAHHPGLLRSWTDLREHIVNATSLGPERSEIVILRTAMRLESSYEWSHHIIRGRDRGLSDTRIASLKGPLHKMLPEDRIIAKSVDELLDGARLCDETRGALMSLVGKTGVFDLMATVGFYSTLGFIVNTFDTPLDDDIAAALSAQPLSGDE